MKYILALILVFNISTVFAYRDEHHGYQQAPALERYQRYSSTYYPPRKHRHRHQPKNRSQYFQLQNDSGQCLAVYHNEVEAYECRNHPSQLWQLSGSTIINQNLCLSVRHRGGLYDGQSLRLNRCNGSAKQDWRYDNDQRFYHRRGFCLDLDSNTMYRNGGKIQLWTCHYNDNQRWSRLLVKKRR